MSDASSYPRICNPTEAQSFPPAGVPTTCEPLIAAFEAATGWTLDFEESRSSYRRRKAERLPEAAASGRLQITDLSPSLPPGKSAASREHCDSLASAVSGLYQQLQQYRDELRLANTQLAVPGRIALTQDRSEKLHRLLAQLLQTACNQFGYDSAAIMVIDEATTQLVQRVGIGPHYSQATGNTRSLDQCRADIEALSGGVVVLNKRSEVVSWQAPVPSRAAVCIPIASLDNLHGTLWLAGEAKRELTDSDTNLLEIIAGRIAAELETAALLSHSPVPATGFIAADAATCEEADALETDSLLPAPFEGWQLETPPNPRQGHQFQTLALSQVDHSENLQILVACTNHPAGHDELRLARHAFAVLRGLDLNAEELHKTVACHLRAEAAFEPELRFACLRIDPLSGEFECHGHPEIRANLATDGNIDTCVQTRRFGFLVRGNSIRMACNTCAADLLLIRRQ